MEYGKSEYPVERAQYGEGITISDEGTYPDRLHHHVALKRDLEARHITMIAIGGAIGTGLIIGTGAALAAAGPASIFIAYTIMGVIVFLVMCALGEMATWLPTGKNFAGYASRFCDPALGFSLGYTYLFKYLITTPNQLTAAALVIQYWCPRDRVNPGAFIAVFLVVIIFINYFGVRVFGELEFWLSSIKVLVIVGLIILSLILALGGGPDHDRKGFRYWNNPGAFKESHGSGSWGRFLGVWSSMVTAVFAYLGTELVGVTVGEAQNPRKVIPRAIKLTFFRILFFYCISVLLLGMIVPYNSPQLVFANKQASNAAASPFVVAISISGIKVLPGFLNGCFLIFTFSASNSDLYIGTRTLYGLALDGKAPKFFAYTDKRGVPYWSLAFCSTFCLIAFLNVSDDSRTVFLYFVNLVTIFGLLTWISILVTHIFFVRARKAQGIFKDSMAFTAPLGVYGSYGALVFCIIIAFTKNFTVFIPSPSTYGNFDYKNFITGYLGIPLYIIMIFGYKLIMRSKMVRPHAADFYSGKQEIDDQEAEFLRQKAEKKAMKGDRGGKLYRLISWLF
ncbi:amino acid permease Dip5 [Rhizodiscina lignyota]|uniref:Amino acid permease Dip5 n=1 Tax=Rhizodiscina lignyota TaxID=1504668 RepID=A0A9P4IN76_9PEZI|nr:amino acid permease Dip5 [Rhizodiscina lignyota]